MYWPKNDSLFPVCNAQLSSLVRKRGSTFHIFLKQSIALSEFLLHGTFLDTLFFVMMEVREKLGEGRKNRISIEK